MAEFTKERIIEDLKASTQNASGMFEIGEDTICALMSMLTNAAPQLPQTAVSDAISTRQAISKMEECDPCDSINVAYKYGWNACRAAMLQGTETVQGWIPCSERMPEEVGRYWCYVEEQNSLGKSHYQWNCSWNGELWGGEMMYGRVTHWMPLQEPPKQTSES